MLWRILDKLKQEIIVKLKTFIVDLTPMLEGLGIQAAKTVRVTTLLLSSASNKVCLCNFYILRKENVQDLIYIYMQTYL
jgi:hypothetical protein